MPFLFLKQRTEVLPDEKKRKRYDVSGVIGEDGGNALDNFADAWERRTFTEADVDAALDGHLDL